METISHKLEDWTENVLKQCTPGAWFSCYILHKIQTASLKTKSIQVIFTTYMYNKLASKTQFRKIPNKNQTVTWKDLFSCLKYYTVLSRVEHCLVNIEADIHVYVMYFNFILSPTRVVQKLLYGNGILL